MSSALRRAFATVLFLVLVSWVYEPLMRCGPLGPDFEVLVGASRLAFPGLDGAAPGGDGWQRLYAAPGAQGHPLGGLSLALSALTFTRGGIWTERAVHLLRVENLLLLFATGAFLGRFVRRMLLPWTGSEQALAAGRASGLVFCVHPLVVSAVAAPGAHALLLGGLFAAIAGLAFVRGRQERRYDLVVLAAAATLACAASSDLAWVLAPALALTEYVSAHRYRPAPRRVKTSLTTLACFGAVAVVPVALRALLGLDAADLGVGRSFASFDAPQPGWRSIIIGLERLGFSILPVNAASRGATGFILGVGLMLVAVQPALQAARAAPRLWAGVAGSWVAVALFAVAYRLDARVQPLDLSQAASLLPAAAVMASGMGLCATALTGRRRLVIPAVVIVGAGMLTRSDAGCIERAANAAELLLHDLALVRAEHGAQRPVLVVDPPRLVTGHPATAARMEFMLDPAFGTQGPPAEDAWVRGVDGPGLRALAVSGELDLLRAEELVVVVPQRLLEEGPTPPGARRTHVLLEAPRESHGPREWDGAPRSPALDLEALEVLALEVEPGRGAVGGGAPTLTWEATTEEIPEGAARGAWIEQGDARPRALFDLSSNFRWLLAGRVRRIELDPGLGAVARAAAAALPSLDELGLPRADGDDWLVGGPLEEVVEEGGPELPRYVLTLVATDDFATLEVEGRLGDDGLRFADAEPFARACREAGGLLWTIEERVGGNAVRRALGR